MIGVVPALNACEGEHSRGFTFLGAKGPGEDLFVSFHDLRLSAQRRAAHYAAAGLRRGDRVALVVPEGEHFIPAFLGALWGGLIPVPLYPPVSLGKLDAFMEALVGILNIARPRVLVTTERVGKVLWSAVGRLPLYHDMGLIGFVIAPVCYRISVVFIPTMSFIKNATLWMETIHKHRATLSFAPNFAYALVTKRAKPEQIARWDLSQMRVFGCGAEPINPGTMRAFLQAMAPAGLKPEALLPCYGMAEATLAISFVPLDEPLQTDRIDAERYHADHEAAPVSNGSAFLEVVSCGRTFVGHEVTVQDDDGRILPERHIGGICFRGPSLTAGYWENPEATQAAFRGGWLHTGDLGYKVGDRVFVSGRIKDILIVNGRNYHPQGIEWLLDEIPGVRKGTSVVFTRPGAASEEIVVAAEARAGDAGALKAQIVARVSEEFQLAVSDVALVPPGTLPKTSSGKLQRRKTREQYLNGSIGRTSRAGSTRLAVAKHLALSLVGRARHEVRKLLGG